MIAVAVAVACSPRVPGKVHLDEPSAKPTQRTDETATPTLHIVAEGAGYSDSPALRLCPVDGRMFICGTALGFREGGFADTGMRIPEGGVAGSLPDDLWTIFRDRYGGEVMHWNPSARKWAQTGFRLRHTDEDMGLRTVEILSWWKGTVLVVDQGPEGRLDLAVWGQGAPLAAPTLLLEDGSRVLDEVHHVVTFDSGGLLMIGPRGPHRAERVATWASRSARPAVSVLGDGALFVNQLVRVAERDLVAVGGHPQHGASGFEFTGGRWVPLALPKGHDSAQSYARSPTGTEWVTLLGVSGAGVSLWSRQPGGPWVRVRHPEPTPVTRGFDADSKGAQVWVQTDGQVWLHLTHRSCGRSVRTILTEQVPARGVCWVWGVHEECGALAAYPPDQWDWREDTCGP